MLQLLPLPNLPISPILYGGGSSVWKRQKGIDLDDFLFQKQKTKPQILSFKSLGVPKIFSQVIKTQSVIENSSEEEESIISVSEFLRSSTDCLSETSDYLSCSSDCRPSSCEEWDKYLNNFIDNSSEKVII